MSARRRVRTESATRLLMALYLVIPAAPLVASCPDLLVPRNYAVPSNAVVSGDFDNDGDTDLASTAPQSLSILLSNGDGTFAPAVSNAVTSYGPLVAGDFDGDLDLDLAVVGTQTQTVSVHLGDGTGAFAVAVDYPLPAFAGAIAAADFDEDGDLDLALTTAAPAEGVSILPGGGDGTFGNAQTFPAGSGLSRILVADYNGDGHEDLAVAHTTSFEISILLGTGGGAFAAPSPVALPSAAPAIAGGDFDGDGVADIAAVASTTLRVLSGNGDGTFAVGNAYPFTRPVIAIVAGDWNGDGRSDLALTDDEKSWVFLGRGAGPPAFAGRFAYGVSNANASSIATGDFNVDGKADLAIAFGGGLSILPGAGDGRFAAEEFFLQGYVLDAVAGDFNSDGKSDAAVFVQSEGLLAVLAGDGFGGFADPIYYPSGTSTGMEPYVYHLTTADFNGDGAPDVGIAAGDPFVTHFGRVYTLIGDGDGGFLAPVPYVVSEPMDIAAGDLNGDGRDDLVAASYGAGVSVLLANADGSLQSPVVVPAASQLLSIALADFNGDAKLDLAITKAAATDNLFVLPGNGDGTFGAIATLQSGSGEVMTADLNGDSHADIVTVSGAEASVLLGNGAGGFAAAVPYALTDAGYAAVAADFDGDGNVDIATTSGTTDVVTPHSVLWGNGDGTFRSAVLFSGALGGAGLAAADFNGDAAADLFIAQLNSRRTCSLVLSSYPNVAVTAPPSVAVGSTGNVASVPNHLGSTYAWAITGATITAGQGTSSIQFDAGTAGTRMTVSVTETTATGCAKGSTPVMVDFLDVPPSHPFHSFVVKLARNGITGGCGGGNYCPNANVLRSQMAVFLLRGEHGEAYAPPPATGIFADVTVPSFFADFIEQLYNEGITGGCATNPLRYCPGASVLRSQMAIFLLRAEHGAAYVPPPATGIFADVPPGSFGADFIEQLYGEGITGGCAINPLRYCPNDPTNRGAMAVFLTRTFSLP